VHLTTSADSPDYRNLITVRGTMATGEVISVSGTLSGARKLREKIVEVAGYEVDIEPTDHMAFYRYADRPGIVGTVGRVLGEADINIASMQVGRLAKGGPALVALTVDSAIPAEILAELKTAIAADWVRAVDLT
jgi:D-3-phosphoglycerate dehydrogenase